MTLSTENRGDKHAILVCTLAWWCLTPTPGMLSASRLITYLGSGNMTRLSTWVRPSVSTRAARICRNLLARKAVMLVATVCCGKRKKININKRGQTESEEAMFQGKGNARNDSVT